jgi:hypothetical protein
MSPLAVSAEERDTAGMRQGRLRSRVTAGLVVCGVLVSLAACTSVLGVGSFEVDPCFDGCDGGTEGGGQDAPVANDGKPPPDTATGDGACVQMPADGAACLCPCGTTLLNGSCVETPAVAPATLPSARCQTPMQMPDCALKLTLHVCDTDPTFTVAEPKCLSEAGANTRATGFIRLGNAPGGTWKFNIIAPFSVSTASGTCTTGGWPCVTDGIETTVTSNAAAPNGTVVAISKRDVIGCQDIDITLNPN